MAFPIIQRDHAALTLPLSERGRKSAQRRHRKPVTDTRYGKSTMPLSCLALTISSCANGGGHLTLAEHESKNQPYLDTGGEFVSKPPEEIWTTVVRRLR
jgi:hypothetical protein